MRLGRDDFPDYSQPMPAGIEFPEITDADPLYHQLMEEQAEDRRRWAASDLAKTEMQTLADPSVPTPDWKIIPKKTAHRLKVFVWND